VFDRYMTAGERTDAPQGGDYIYIEAGTVVIKTDTGRQRTLKKGQGWGPGEFSLLTIENRGPNGRVAVNAGYGVMADSGEGASVEVSNPLNIASMPAIPVENTVNVPQYQPSNAFGALPDVDLLANTAKQVAPANATRRELIIKNSSVNTESVRIGGATVALNAGVEIEPGETAVFTTTDAVHAICVGAQSLSVTETEYSA